MMTVQLPLSLHALTRLTVGGGLCAQNNCGPDRDARGRGSCRGFPRLWASPRIGAFALALLMVAAAPKRMFAQSDPLVGTWTTDILKSKTEPGPARWKSWTSRIDRVADGYTVTGDGVTAEGRIVHSKAIWRFDGKEAPTVGDEPAAAYAWRRIDQNTFETVRTDANGTITSRTVISPDGRMRVNFHTVRNSQGQTVRSVFEVMYRQ